MPASKLLKLPYGSYLMVRLDYKIICGDELEAKIMRIIEMYMEVERTILYKEMLNDPQNALDPSEEVDVTRDVWAAISHRLFKSDLYDQDMSENTLKRAIKSLRKKNFIKVREAGLKRYEAPKYQINTDVVQKELNTLGKLGKTEYQKLMVSKIDGIKNSSHQNLTPSGYQNLTPSSASRVSKFDPNSRRVTEVEDTEEGGTDGSANASPTPAHSIAINAPTHEENEHDSQSADRIDRASEGAPDSNGYENDDTQKRSAGRVPAQQLSTLQASSAHQRAKVEPQKPTQERKRGTQGKKVEEPEPIVLSPEAEKIWRAWCSLFTVEVELIPSNAAAAEKLVKPARAWCSKLHWTLAEWLKSIKDNAYAADNKGYYRKRGVKLFDIPRELEGWQSAKEHELATLAQAANPTDPKPIDPTLQALRQQLMRYAQGAMS